MADYFAAEITLGGNVPTAVVPELCRRICDLGLSDDDEQSCFKPEAASDLLDGCREIDGVRLLRLSDSEAYFGRFASLETFLQKKGISYCRITDSKYEHDGEIVEFRPEMGLVRTLASKSGEPLMPLHAVREALSSLYLVQTLLDSRRERKAQAVLRRCCKQLGQSLPPLVPPLPAFELV